MEQNPNPTPAPGPQSIPAVVPAAAVTGTWPGGFGAFKPSRDAIRISLGTLLWLFLISIVANGLSNAKLNHHGFNILVNIIGLLLTAFMIGAQSTTFLAGIQGKRTEFNDAVQAGLKYFVPALILTVLVSIASLLSIILLVIPAFFVIPRLVLAPYFLVDQNMDAVTAFKASWNASRGHVGKIYGIAGVAILMILPVITVIGGLATIYFLFMYSAVGALLYTHVRKHQSQPSDQPLAPAPSAPSAAS